ncbi:MAG TPA: gas vesicle protein [Gemmatimonadaceae bacterium]|nr:gas vesicle protein [Gemmatimonadaceae bacterium]
MPELVNPARSYGLVDILDRVLDKGLVIAGDIKINLANVELLTIQVRLLVCSIDKAEQIGLNWWRTDPRLSVSGAANAVAGEVDRRLQRIERQLAELAGRSSGGEGTGGGSPRQKRER